MRKSVTVILTMALALMILGLAAAVPDGTPLESAVARHKDEYLPEEYDFLRDVGAPQSRDDSGIDFGDEGDPGIDFGDEDFFPEEDAGADDGYDFLDLFPGDE